MLETSDGSPSLVFSGHFKVTIKGTLPLQQVDPFISFMQPVQQEGLLQFRGKVQHALNLLRFIRRQKQARRFGQTFQRVIVFRPAVARWVKA